MSSPSSVIEADVRILRQGQLDAGIAHDFGAQLLADITHLPTGATSNRMDTVVVPPGGRSAAHPARSAPTLLHVVAGTARVSWGRESQHTLVATTGDTALVPAGTSFQAVNASTAEALRFILVSGS